MEKIKECLLKIDKDKLIICIIAIGFTVLFLSMVHWIANIEKEVSILRTEKADKKEVNGIQTMLDVLTGVKESKQTTPPEYLKYE